MLREEIERNRTALLGLLVLALVCTCQRGDGPALQPWSAFRAGPEPQQGPGKVRQPKARPKSEK